MRRGPHHRWLSRATTATMFVCCAMAGDAHSAMLRVPENFPGIQAALNAAQDGDTVLVARGAHAGNLVISGKRLTLASRFILTGDPNDIALTTISGGSPILTIESDAGAATTVRGLTFLDGDYQLVVRARGARLLDDRFISGSTDLVSFEGGGGVVRNCLFEDAGDDGIDSDDDSDPTIEDNIIRNCGDDGIELRLHDFTGPTLDIAIRGNVITGCGEDGIQLIDYPGASNRVIRIERNILANNADAGLGTMANGNTTENFAGAAMVEQVRVIGNTFVGHSHGLTGGDNMLVMNNIFVGAAQIGVKRVAASSLVTHNDFWNNATNHTGSNVDAWTTLLQNPMLESDYDLQSGSPCIDEGASSIVWNGTTVHAPAYSGAAPDLGAREVAGPPVDVDSTSSSSRLSLTGLRPNPSSDGVTLALTLLDADPARVDVVDIAGRVVLSRELSGLGAGRHSVILAETRDLPAGLYLVRLRQGGQSRSATLVVR